jgi:predicted kinase
VGALGPASLTAAESELRQMEAQSARVKLNIDEIRASALPPRDDLNAPLVESRDFVTDRMNLDLFTAQQRMTAAEQALAQAEDRWRVGSVPEMTVQDARLELTKARAALGTLAERRKLRKEFVEQGTDVEQLNRRFQQAQARFDAMVVQEAVKVMLERVKLLRERRAVGEASELDVLRAEIELKEREAELLLLARQLRGLSKPS